MTFGQFFSILRARWWVALLVLLLTVVATVVVSLMLTKKYTGSAAVVIDFKPDPISAAFYGGAPPPALMATQVDIIKSDRIGLRVVRNLKLSETPGVRKQWQDATDGQGSLETWLVELVERNLEVLPSRESSVITVTYKAADPKFAAAMANAIVQAYVETSLELRVDPARQYAGFFDVRAKDARETLERAQSRLSAFQRQAGIVATDERLDVETARLNELSTQMVALQAISAESRSRQTQATSGQSERMQEVLLNPVVGGLKAEISRTEAQLQALTSRLGDAHPQVQETRASLAELRSRLDAETQRVSSGVGVSNTINRDREAQVRAQLEAQRDKVLRMKAVRDEGAVIQRDLENAQRSYDAIVARQNQTSLESQTTQSNVHVLTQASPPVEPSSPRLLFNLYLSIFGGTLLGVGLALLLELRDRRMRVIDDVVVGLGLPVLGVMPRAGARVARGGRGPSIQQRLLAPLPAPRKAA